MKFGRKRNPLISIFLHGLLLLLVYIFQGAVFPYLRLGGLVPLLLPAAVTGIALYEGRYIGGVFGLFAGMLCDVSFNQPVGTFTFVLTVVGLGVGMISEAIMLSSFTTYYISCVVVLIICVFVQMTPIIAMPGGPTVGNVIGTATAQTVYSLITAIPIWFLVRTLGQYVRQN